MASVHIHCPAVLSATTVLWRAQGELRVSLLVRGDFQFTNGRNTFVTATALRAGTSSYERQLRALALMPAGEETDLLVFAHAHSGDVAGVLEAAGQRPLVVRVALLRNGVPLIDERRKRIVGEPADFDPPKPEPARHRLLESLAESTPDTVIEIPDDADPSLFQSAPPEMRFDGLRGGEYLLLKNLHPERTYNALRLPAVRMRARALIAGMRLPLDLKPGIVAVNTRLERGTIIWRGHFPVYDEASLSTAELWAVPEQLAPSAAQAQSGSDEAEADASETSTWPSSLDKQLERHVFTGLERSSFPDEVTAWLVIPQKRGPAIPFPAGRSTVNQPRAIPGAPWSQAKSATVLPPKRDKPDTQPPPDSQLPDSQAPETQLPETQSPETQSPETQSPETQSPETQSPETQSPETQPPETQPKLVAAQPPATLPPEPIETREPTPAETKPALKKPAVKKPAKAKPAKAKPTETKPAAATPAETSPAAKKPKADALSRIEPLLSAEAAEERRKAEALRFEQSQARAKERERKERETKRNKATEAISSFYDSLAPPRADSG